MKKLNPSSSSTYKQHLISSILVLGVAVACFYASPFIGYRIVALVLLMTVSLIAMLFEIMPVLLAAVLSAVIWNFFFIPPIYTFHISDTEDVMMFLLYFFVALVNAVLTFKIREAEKKARDKEEKEHTIKLYNTLLNSLSHELRTPVSTILGAVDTLKENSGKLTLANQGDLLKVIDAASVRLNRQVENLLNMSRLESGMLKLNIDWCDINELIHSMLQKITVSNNHQLVFQAREDLPLMRLDRGLMEQVMHNLIHNAIQYTPENSTIELTAAYESGYCCITISDNGRGFPESEIEAVFKKFYRLTDSKPGGSGLGLSIAKGFVEAHHGTIWLENKKNGGALFTIHLPVETSFLNNLKNE